MNWNFEDFLRRLEAIKGMGSIEELMAQVPDLQALLKEFDFDFTDLDPIERILRAMSLEERLDPRLLDGDDEGYDRRVRIAEEAATTIDAVDNLINQFKDLIERLETKTPEEVIQELVDTVQPQYESWQSSPDAWKGDGAPPIAASSTEETPPAPEKPDPWLKFNEILDEILRKIAKTGMDSLSDQERGFLEEASRRIRTAKT